MFDVMKLTGRIITLGIRTLKQAPLPLAMYLVRVGPEQAVCLKEKSSNDSWPAMFGAKWVGDS